MKINKAELQNALEKVKPGLANKEIIEQSTSFAFMDGKVVTYNDEISISHPVKGLDLTGAIKAQELYQFLGKIKQDEIDIDWDDSQVKITAGRAKVGLILQNEVRLPVEEIGKIGTWKPLPDKFIEGVQFCRNSCSKDMSRPVLTCVHVKKDGTVIGSDGYRLTVYAMLQEMPITAFLIPATSINELLKYKITQIARGEGWIHFKTEDDTIFSCRVFEDNYPDVSGIPKFEGQKIQLPKKMREALERAEIFAKREFSIDSEVTVTIEEGQMLITAHADSGWFEEVIRIRYKDTPIQFQAHPSFLAEMLDKVNDCELGQDRMKFEGDNWVHVVALVVKV